MNYRKMIEVARHKGVTTEKAMLDSIDDIDTLLDMMKDEHPKEYSTFMRKTHQNLYGHHYDEHYASKDVSRLEYTDKHGRSNIGEHWSKQQVLSATQGKTFPAGTTDCDKWVAYNAAYADFCKRFTDDEILDIAYLFFFADEDYEGEGKIWDYMAIGSYN